MSVTLNYMQAAAILGLALFIGLWNGMNIYWIRARREMTRKRPELSDTEIAEYQRIREKREAFEARWATWAEDTDLGRA